MKLRQFKAIQNILKMERNDQALDQFRILKVITNIKDIIISRQFLMSLDKYYLDLKLNENQIITLIQEAEIYDIAFIFRNLNLSNRNKKIQFEMDKKISNEIHTKQLRQLFLIDEILENKNQLYQLIIQDFLQFLTNVYTHKFQFSLIYDQMIKVSFLVINNNNLIQSQNMILWMDQIIDIAFQKMDTYGWYVIIDNIMSGFMQIEFDQFQPIIVAQLWISRLYDFNKLFNYFGPYIINQYQINIQLFENLLKYKASSNSIKFFVQLCAHVISSNKTQLYTQISGLFPVFYEYLPNPLLVEDSLEFFNIYLRAAINGQKYINELVSKLKDIKLLHDKTIQLKINQFIKTYQNQRSPTPQYAQSYYKTGIRNIQNTCYFGSFMQILFQSKQFVDKIKNKKNDSPFIREDNIFESLSKMFCYLYYQNNIVDFYPIQQFRSIRNDYHFAKQHDVGEFILHFFEDLEKQHEKQYNAIKPLFVGVQQCNFKCLNCGSERTGPEEDCLMLSLTIIEQMSVQQLIALLQEEKVQLDCQCGVSQQFGKTIHFVKTQEYFFIQLNRFRYNQGFKEKIFTSVKIDQEISIQKKVGIQGYKYYGMINHMGQSSEIGHYLSYAMIDSATYRFDDAYVGASEDDKPEKMFLPYETPYIICYKAV